MSPRNVWKSQTFDQPGKYSPTSFIDAVQRVAIQGYLTRSPSHSIRIPLLKYKVDAQGQVPTLFCGLAAIFAVNCIKDERPNNRNEESFSFLVMLHKRITTKYGQNELIQQIMLKQILRTLLKTYLK